MLAEEASGLPAKGRLKRLVLSIQPAAREIARCRQCIGAAGP